jgi:hypothetical protein
LGGKNSKEIDRSPAAIRSLTLGAPSAEDEGVRSVIRNSIGGSVPAPREVLAQRAG